MKRKKIVILGAGFGGVYTFLRLHDYFHNRDDVEILVINKTNYFSFSPLLHEVSMGGIARENITSSVRSIIHCCIAKFIQSTVKKIDVTKRIVTLKNGDTITYDYLVIGLGAKPRYFGIPGAQHHSFPLHTLRDAITIRNHIIDTLERAEKTPDKAERERLLTFTIVGGGAIGTEIAPELVDLLENWKQYYTVLQKHPYNVLLVSSSTRLIQPFGPNFSSVAEQTFKRMHIKIMSETRAIEVKPDSLVVQHANKKKQTINTCTVIWGTGVQPISIDVIPRSARDERGMFPVEQTLQLKGHNSVFVLGDISHFPTQDNRGLPLTAQVATQQGRTVGDNIVRLMQKKEPKSFVYHEKGLTTSLGRKKAILKIGPFHYSGPGSWFMYRTIYFWKLVGTMNKIKVGVDWFLDLFLRRRNARF